MNGDVPHSALQIGSIAVAGVPDGIGRVRPEQLYAAAGKSPDEVGKGGRDSDWEPHRQLLPTGGTIEMPVGCFLVRTSDRLILVDAGYGPNRPARVTGPDLLTSLRRLGVAPQDVTDVVLTHLHVDHIGWLAVNGVATFTNAVYRCHQADWAHFVDGASDENALDRAYRKTAAALLSPLAARFEPWTGDVTVARGVDVVGAPGHTPGSSVVVLSWGTERAMLLGDVVHHPVQLVDEEWERVADVDDELARRTQRLVTAELVDQGMLAVGAHFPGLRFGRVVEVDGIRSWRAEPGVGL